MDFLFCGMPIQDWFVCLGVCFFVVVVNFSIGQFAFFLLIQRRTANSLDMSPSLAICAANISYSVTNLLILFFLFLDDHKLIILML